MILQIGLLLMLLSWLQPLHIRPWVSWHSEVLVFAALAMLIARGLWLAWRGPVARTALPFPSLAWVLSGLLLLVIAQTVSGKITFTGDALVLALYLMLGVGSLMLGAASKCAEQNPKASSAQPDALLILAGTLLLGAVLSSMVAFVQLTDVWNDVEWINRTELQRRPGGNLGQPNQLATLLLMGVASLVFLWEKGKLGTISSLLIFLVLIAGLTVTESRAGQLSLLALAGWWFFGRLRVGFRLGTAVALTGVVLSLLAFWLWPHMLQLGGSGVEASAVRPLLSGGGRLIVWPQLWEAVLLHPWVGWGLHEVSAAHNAVVHTYAVSEPYGYAHNLVLDMVLGMGLPLTMLLVLATIYGLWRRMSAVNSHDAWFCIAAVIPVLMHSMLEFPHAYAYFLAPIMFLVGRLDTEVVRSAPWQMRRGLASAIFMATLVVSVGTVVEYVAIEEDFAVARFEVLRVGQTPEVHVRPTIRLLTQLGALLEGSRIEPKPMMNPRELELVRSVALRYPWPAMQNRYALALALNGQPLEARRQLQVMRAQTRYNERLYASVKDQWRELADNEYPQLKSIDLP